MIKARVLRRHAGGYLVHSDQLNAIFQCSLRARLKKEGVSIVTGDYVEIEEIELEELTLVEHNLNEFNEENEKVNEKSKKDEKKNIQERTGQAVIVSRYERKNLLRRPYLANIDQIFLVQSIHQPDWNSLMCDRHLVHFQLELDKVKCFICINKCDLASLSEMEELRSIYESLSYSVIFISTKTAKGLAELKSLVKSRNSVLVGPSGVGKSSIINCLIPDLNLRVDVNEELFIGRHTTTHSELYKLPEELNDSGFRSPAGWICDTPGFNIGELDYPQPADIAWQFPEIVKLAEECRFSNCLHLPESQECNISANLAKISESRYSSYCVIVSDAQEKAKLMKETSNKTEFGTTKYVGGKNKARILPKLNERFRASSRKKEKQSLSIYRKTNHEDLVGEGFDEGFDEGLDELIGDDNAG